MRRWLPAQPRGGTVTTQDSRGSGVFRPPCLQGLGSRPETEPQALRSESMESYAWVSWEFPRLRAFGGF